MKTKSAKKSAAAATHSRLVIETPLQKANLEPLAITIRGQLAQGDLPEIIDITSSPALDWSGVALCIGVAHELSRRGEHPVLVAGPLATFFKDLGIQRLFEIRE